MRPVSKKQDIVAILAALSVFLSFIEYLIPKPVPFLKLGFANLPLLVGLRLLSPAYFFLLVATKILAQGILNGTLLSYVVLFTLGGSLSSAGIMLLLQTLFKERISLVGISIMGALASNLVQLTLARVIVFGPATWLLAPPFILTGIISSILLGVFAHRFYLKSRWITQLRSEGGEYASSLLQ